MNADLTILMAVKGNASVIHNTSGYSRKIGAFLEGPTWRRIAKDTTETVENRTRLKKLALATEVSFCLVIIHQSPLYNILKSKNHKMQWNACDSFLECNNLNPKMLVQSKGVSIFWKNPKDF